MSKRIFAALVCLPFAFICFAAQLTATLQSGDNFTPFYGTNAFVEAYNASVDGDVITLSAGVFTPTSIEKGITVIGTYAFSSDASKATIINTKFSVIADNVTLEGIYAYCTLTIKGANNLSIRRSHIHVLDEIENGEKKYHDNTIISDCIINYCKSMALSKNAVFRNSCINQFSNLNDASNPALIENCNIPIFALWATNGLSPDLRQPYAIYRNCFLGLYSKSTYSSGTHYINLYSPSEFHNVIFFSNYYYDVSNSSKSWNIQYNSCITNNAVFGGKNYNVLSTTNCINYNSMSSYEYNGMIVGPTDVKKEPSIPKITSSEIDTETDAEGNIHVKISAIARD